ncbi:MAG: SRPBCC family protein [Microlunatus sp.]|nr:SRPBCC family protein [Microlunatus sp.]
MRRTLAAAGDSAPDEVWQRYVHLDSWAQWAPFIADVETPSRELQPGLTGRVISVGGLAVSFQIIAVDPLTRTWRWRAQIGPVDLVLDHEVIARPGGGSVAVLVVSGRAPAVLSYSPAARLALSALVRP